MAKKSRDDDHEELPIDAPEGDAAEQSRSWAEDDQDRPSRPSIPPDAPEADVLDQSRPADLDDEDRDHG
ncbi:MAG: hypothetical protein ACRDKB_07340 [Actinomycetota bacterium]